LCEVSVGVKREC